jgi:outer membrane protein OmpA-like peptidoglycan-associated protein
MQADGVMKDMNAISRIAAVVAVAGLLGTAACATSSRTTKGGVIGAAGGAVAGGLIGKAAGSTAKGAIIGAAVGGAAGLIIGQRMDKQAAELEKEIPGAEVERVGEGILVTFDSGILYDYDSAVVKPAARDNLRELVTSLEKYPGTNVVLVGHTDADGADAYNQTLSERRASAAADYLVSQGVPRARIDATGRGEAEPVAANDTADGKARNRRVEIAIFANESLRNEAAKK